MSCVGSNPTLSAKGEIMLDIKEIRKDPERFKTGLTNKGFDATVIDQVLILDKQRRKLIAELEQARCEKKSLTKQFYEEYVKEK